MEFLVIEVKLLDNIHLRANWVKSHKITITIKSKHESIIN